MQDLTPNLLKGKRPPPEGWWGKKHIREIRVGYAVLALIYVFAILIPLLYVWGAETPELGELRQTEGRLTCEEIGNRGNYLTGIKTQVGPTLLLTCSNGRYGSYPNCVGPTIKNCKMLADKKATAWWYEQPDYLFSKQNRLARLVVEDEVKVPYEKTIELTEKAALSSAWFILFLLGLFVSIVIGFERMIRRHRHE